MEWLINDKEYASVLSLPAPKRYEYFVKKVADRGEMWSLWSTAGWVLAGDESGNEAVPVWPHARFARAFAVGEWTGEARAIELGAWMERWTPGMLKDHRLVAVFPTSGSKGMIIPPERLRDDLEKELSLYE